MDGQALRGLAQARNRRGDHTQVGLRGGGEIGVITSVTEPFCGDCTRARLSSDGQLYTCLFATHGTDLRALLRGGATDSEISEAIRGVWGARRSVQREWRPRKQERPSSG